MEVVPELFRLLTFRVNPMHYHSSGFHYYFVSYFVSFSDVELVSSPFVLLLPVFAMRASLQTRVSSLPIKVYMF